MGEKFSKFHFPADIKLKSNSLLEAWLDIRWQLVPTNVPGFMKDPGFPFALGAFYQSIKDKFGYREDLEASQTPEDMFPHVVRHRFRPKEGQWPILQLGPGVASVNFTDSYSWSDFLEAALYLREELLSAYSETELKLQMIALRYRNGIPFQFSSNSSLDFLKQHLNVSVELPVHIPGSVSLQTWPTNIHLTTTFNLSDPQGKGTLKFGTAMGTEKSAESNQEIKREMLVWELEVKSEYNNTPNLDKKDEFASWLASAHGVIHEWFFSLIEGPLFEKYSGEES